MATRTHKGSKGHAIQARRRKARALARAIGEYNAHFPGDPITAETLAELSPGMWETLARCATSLEGALVHPPGSDETIAAVAAELSRLGKAA